MTRQLLASILSLALMVGWSASLNAADEPGKPTPIGEKLANSNSLRDLRGGKRTVQGFTGNKAIVLMFLGADCPVSNLYMPTLVELEKKYREQKVLFLAIYPNEAEDFDQIAGHANDRDLPCLVLKDFGQRLAKLAGVTRVPSVAVLDGDFNFRYRGQIDDRYGAATRKPKATRDDLREAIDEVVAGKKVTIAETEADGCLISGQTKSTVKTEVNYAKHVAPILQKRCQACHRPDQNAPFALLTYDDAVKHAPMLREVTSQRRMPPWQADPRFGHFSNDRRLSREEIDTVAAWVDQGMPKGDDKDLPKPIQWPTGWVHGKPDLVLTMPEEFEVPADGVLPYKNWIIDPGFTEDKWVTISEAKPSDPSVVHHIVVYMMKGGSNNPIGPDGSIAILVGWAPGDLGLVCPPDTAMRVPKGTKLRLEMHYTPNGKKVKDRSSVGLTFAAKPPKFELFMSEFANMGFEITPSNPHYKAEATFKLRADARIISFAPHMHWRGKDYMYEVIYPDGKKETLLSVPRWDFNWQNVYRFQEPLKVPKGTKIHSVAHWDNSTNNPYNPDPKSPVRFGLQTWEEMMVGFISYVWERPETAAELAKNPPTMAEQLFDRLDTDGDGFITQAEIPERLKPIIAASGVPLPDKISREEFSKLVGGMLGKFQPKKGADGKKEEKKP
jgi:thiol-disulfide isomerase/thioredoxin/mono/diheme cytochrome c family protein